MHSSTSAARSPIYDDAWADFRQCSRLALEDAIEPGGDELRRRNGRREAVAA